MIICPTCGAQNDPGNRFCDQCGTRLEPAAARGIMAAPTLQTSDVDKQSAPIVAPLATLSCPNCGAAVIPGQAFCDECGFPLNTMMSDAAASEAPTLIDISQNSELQQSPTLLAPGTMNDSDATLITSPAESPVVPPAVHQPVSPSSDLETILMPPPEFQPPPPVPEPASEPMPDLDSLLAPPLPAPQPDIASPPEPEPVYTKESVSPALALESPPTPEKLPPELAPATDQARRQHLEGLIAAHRETIAQYEQMLTRYPAGTAPPFLVTGLDEARKALAQAEADLTALSVAPAPDPAEVARLEGLIAAHRETIAQYQQMYDRYPAGAVPAFLKAGLDEAQKALAETEAQLATLRGAPIEPVATSPSLVPPPAPAPVPVAPAPVAPSATTPRLVLVSNGQELPLPPGKTEIIIGREDPVSQIFPEIDLTPHGGESGGVSRQHARISQQNGQWTIVDLNSTNYTRVDGTRIEPNTPTPIYDGTQIHFGRVAVVFHT